MAFNPNLMAALATHGAPNQNNPAATAALSRSIASLHQYLDLETDPKKRATATGCLARLEPLRGEHLEPAPPPAASSGPGPPAGGPPGY